MAAFDQDEVVRPVPRLGDRDAHVWHIELSRSHEYVERASRILSAAERARAGQFLSPAHQAAFVVARSALRSILAGYLGMPATQIVFECGPHGKPSVAGTRLQFNLSHSGYRAAIAVTSFSSVGIDIESRRPHEVVAIADRMFTARESRELRGLEEAHRLDGFLRCWTRKEAYLKARGDGLSSPLNQFEVSFLPGEPPALRWSVHGADEPARWNIFEFEAGPAHVGALVVEQAVSEVRPLGWWNSLRDASSSS